MKRYMILALVLACLLLNGCASVQNDLNILSGEQDKEARLEAADHLAKSQDKEAIKKLIEASKTSELASQGVGEVRDSLIAESLVKETDLLKTIDCLQVIGDEASYDKIFSMMLIAEDIKVLKKILDIITSTDNDQAIPYLVEFLSVSPDEGLTTTVENIIMAYDNRAVPCLMQTAKDNVADSAEFINATDLLAGIGEDAILPLVGQLGASSWAKDILIKIGASTADYVYPKIWDKDVRVRADAIKVFSALTESDKSLFNKLTETDIKMLVNLRTEHNDNSEDASAIDNLILGSGSKALPYLAKYYLNQPWAEANIVIIGSPSLPYLEKIAAGGSNETMSKVIGNIQSIAQSDEKATNSILNIIKNKSLKQIRNNYDYYIKLGQTGSEGILANALYKYGNATMCVDYLNCGNDILYKAGERWATSHGYRVLSGGSHYGPSWGSGV
ncbi:MAG: hypothetical protein UT18_C0007G0008 [candidate division CPR2 bacterium GW2011_GWC2_39_10]|uniref:HEAT repeat domain-containing protein n=1 Tax=candidate division CPR2 bacterium GW2011_GWC2_39_10 TaxID=1618345 RepID=A0A0G0LUP6_UNCC2|nr:MAG: hypothetical protein UT18_C0007G0008 [candidate division CPR2 bacterium GW2011_GWC2_39_10]